jgi:hypothetical protein
MHFLVTGSAVRLTAAAALLTLGGCAAAAISNDDDGLKLANPSPAFMKKVERDPFPRAGVANTTTAAAS